MGILDLRKMPVQQSDLYNPEYGFVTGTGDSEMHIDKLLKCTSSEYAMAQGTGTSSSSLTEYGKKTCDWWLRSTGISTDYDWEAAEYEGRKVFGKASASPAFINTRGYIRTYGCSMYECLNADIDLLLLCEKLKNVYSSLKNGGMECEKT